MKQVLFALLAVAALVVCSGKDTRAGASPAPTGDTSHPPVGATLAVARLSAPQTFTDSRDGKTYRAVTIGEQTWMAENLNYKTDSSWCYDNADPHFYLRGNYGEERPNAQDDPFNLNAMNSVFAAAQRLYDKLSESDSHEKAVAEVVKYCKDQPIVKEVEVAKGGIMVRCTTGLGGFVVTEPRNR